MVNLDPAAAEAFDAIAAIVGFAGTSSASAGHKGRVVAGIVAGVMVLPSYLGMANDMMVSSVVCLIGLVLTFVLYKRYTDEVTDKTKNTVGQGVTFGVITGGMMTRKKQKHFHETFARR